MRKFRKLAATALIQIFVICIILSITEIILRSLGVLIPDRYYVWPPNLERIFRPDQEIVPGTSLTSQFLTNSDGIRSDRNTPTDDSMRILAFGGSTTEELYLDWSDSWTGQLQGLLNNSELADSATRWWVGNIGKSGSTARSNVLQAHHILPNLPKLDAILWFVGINDTYYTLGAGYMPIRSSEAARRLAFYYWPAGDSWWERLALYRLLQEGITYLYRSERGVVQSDRGEWLLARRHARQSAFDKNNVIQEMPDIIPYLSSYKETLNTMLEVAKSHETRLIIMTQQSLWSQNPPPEIERMLHAGGIGPPGQWQADETSFFSPGILQNTLNQLNEITMSVCQESAAECVDIATSFPKDKTLFYDDVHYTRKGASHIAHLVFNYLIQHDIIRDK